MNEVQAYSLATHDGPYEGWPRRTTLLSEGRATGTRVPVYSLLHQWELADGRRLIVGDIDCPWEQETTILLVGADHRLLDMVHFGLPWGFYLLKDARPVGPTRIELTFVDRGEFVWSVEVLDRPTWFLGSLLRWSRLAATA